MTSHDECLSRRAIATDQIVPLYNTTTAMGPITCTTETASGLVTASAGVTFAGGGATLNYYGGPQTHNTTWTGPWAAPQVGNIRYERVGNTVTLVFPLVSAVRANVAIAQATTPLPADLRPALNLKFVVTSEDNVIVVSTLHINPDGSMIFWSGVTAPGTFGGAANSGWQAVGVSYTV